MNIEILTPEQLAKTEKQLNEHKQALKHYKAKVFNPFNKRSYGLQIDYTQAAIRDLENAIGKYKLTQILK